MKQNLFVMIQNPFVMKHSSFVMIQNPIAVIQRVFAVDQNLFVMKQRVFALKQEINEPIHCVNGELQREKQSNLELVLAYGNLFSQPTEVKAPKK